MITLEAMMTVPEKMTFATLAQYRVNKTSYRANKTMACVNKAKAMNQANTGLYVQTKPINSLVTVLHY